MIQPEWHRWAKCQEYPQEYFFGEERLGERKRHRPTLTSIEIRRAKAICAMCPVLKDCFIHAMENDEEYGVWGGTTHRERKRLKDENAYPSTKGQY